MKATAIKYLNCNPILYMNILEPIRWNSADILYADTDGVMIKERKSGIYMITVENLDKGKELLQPIPKDQLIFTYDKEMADYILEHFSFSKYIVCLQEVYLSKKNLFIREDLVIKEIQPEQINFIAAWYDKISQQEIEQYIQRKTLWGGYKDGTLVGFIGIHPEGSIGLLTVPFEFRNHGYGKTLLSYMVNSLLEKGKIPFSQVDFNNHPSLELHQQLGFQASINHLYCALN